MNNYLVALIGTFLDDTAKQLTAKLWRRVIFPISFNELKLALVRMRGILDGKRAKKIMFLEKDVENRTSFLTLSRKSVFSEMFKVRRAVSGILSVQNKGLFLLCVSEKIGEKQTWHRNGMISLILHITKTHFEILVYVRGLKRKR